jgi:hypothetical protein
MKFKVYFLVTIVITISFPLVSTAQKSYNLFHPVPKDKMREMETDRPDVTESPFTIDAGHIQYETDLIRLEREKGELIDQHTVLLNQANLKIGLTRTTALQFGFQNFGWQKEKDLQTGESTTGHGIGDINIRVKQNLIGNDGGNFVLAILPYLKFPTAKYTNDSKYEGGIIVPMQLQLAGDWKLGGQVEADRLKDTEAEGMHTELLQSLTISHELFRHLEGIAETYYRYDLKEHHWANFLNAAAQVEISKNFKVDAGLNYGLQHDAEKNYFIGTAFRF